MNNYITNKLKEFDELCNKSYSSGGFEFQWEGLDDIRIRKWIEQALTDYHNHIVEKIDELHKSEQEFIVELLKKETGYSYTQA